MPAAVVVTLPIDADSVTGSRSGSAYVPWTVTVSPLCADTDVSFALMSGLSLPFGCTTTSSPSIPFVAWKKMWQWKSQRP